MRYADVEYYKAEYLDYATQVVPDEDFSRWEKLAEAEIDSRTYGRVSALETIPEKVKDCVCAITELLYKANVQSENSASLGLAGPLASWSNDGQSGSVDLGQSVYTETGKQREIARLCRLYLGPLGLLYAGVKHYES